MIDYTKGSTIRKRNKKLCVITKLRGRQSKEIRGEKRKRNREYSKKRGYKPLAASPCSLTLFTNTYTSSVFCSLLFPITWIGPSEFSVLGRNTTPSPLQGFWAHSDSTKPAEPVPVKYSFPALSKELLRAVGQQQQS